MTATKGKQEAKDMSGEFGSVVRLKSGGPAMTVLRAKKRCKKCVWISASGKPQLEWFPNQVLMLSTADDAARPSMHAVS